MWLRHSRKSGLKPKSGVKPRRRSRRRPGDVPRSRKPDDMPEIRVTGVTLTPMRFISLATGQRVFEGGLLPGGYVLESIGVKELKLRKDGRIIVYRLRGSNE